MSVLDVPRNATDIKELWLEKTVLGNKAIEQLDRQDITSAKDEALNFNVLKLKVILKEVPNDKIHWICKVPIVPFEQINLITKTNNLEKEVEFYKKLYPEIDKYLAAANLGSYNIIPPPILAGFDGKHPILLTKDLIAMGYETTEKGKYFNYSQARTGLETLARFHASSYFYKKMIDNNYNGTFSYVHKPLTNDPRLKGLNEVIDMMKCVLLNENTLKDIPKHLNDVSKNITPYRECQQRLRQVLGPLSIVTHGHCHLDNFLFLKNNGKFVACALQNWQFVTETSPLVDVMTFLLMNLQTVVRKNHFNELLEFYFDNLQKGIKLLSGEKLSYPLEQFHSHCRYYALPALYITVYHYAEKYCPELQIARIADTGVKQFVRIVTNKSKTFITPEFHDKVITLLTHMQTARMLPM